MESNSSKKLKLEAKFIQVAPAMLPQQMTMFARKAVVEYPSLGNSADSLGEVEAEDRHRYYVKDDVEGRSVRASEWISTQLSEAVIIAAPPQSIIELFNGKLVFGSRRIAGVADAVVTTSYLTSPTTSNSDLGTSTGLKSILSSIYTFDMFINNVDRHFGNYLSVDDNGTRRLYAFDYSRALFWNWPWNDFPDVKENTRVCGSILRSLHGFDEKSSLNTLDRIEGITQDTIKGFVNSMPQDWISSSPTAYFINWWGSKAWEVRLIV
jgi:hypothetical protein